MISIPRSLEDLAQDFHRVRFEGKRRPRYPKELWQAACALTATHSVPDIAKALGVSLQYFKQRLGLENKVSQDFAQVRTLHSESHSFVEITLKKPSGPLTLRWTGPIKDLPNLVGKLFRGEFS